VVPLTPVEPPSATTNLNLDFSKNGTTPSSTLAMSSSALSTRQNPNPLPVAPLTPKDKTGKQLLHSPAWYALFVLLSLPSGVCARTCARTPGIHTCTRCAVTG
jgi:hypothetical protein